MGDYEMYYDIEKSSERIRLLRMKSGFTQEKAAAMLNIDRSFYSRVEAGKKGCSIDLFIQLSSLFNVSLDYLILGRYLGIQAGSVDRAQLKEDITELVACLEQFRAVI